MHCVKLVKKLLIKKDCSIFYWRNMSNGKTGNGPVESSIRKKLESTLEPSYYNVVNESYMHNVPKGSETHFKVVVVSEKFDKQPLVERHRMINKLLQVELRGGVHALSIVAKTPKQWEESDKGVIASPACKGGFNK